MSFTSFSVPCELSGTCVFARTYKLKYSKLKFEIRAKTQSTAKLAKPRLSFAKHSALLENTPAIIATSKARKESYGIESEASGHARRGHQAYHHQPARKTQL